MEKSVPEYKFSLSRHYLGTKTQKKAFCTTSNIFCINPAEKRQKKDNEFELSPREPKTHKARRKIFLFSVVNEKFDSSVSNFSEISC